MMKAKYNSLHNRTGRIGYLRRRYSFAHGYAALGATKRNHESRDQPGNAHPLKPQQGVAIVHAAKPNRVESCDQDSERNRCTGSSNSIMKEQYPQREHKNKFPSLWKNGYAIRDRSRQFA